MQTGIAGGGYINFYLKRDRILGACLKELGRQESKNGFPPVGQKIIVEHTNINPNKAAHIGHLRNSVLGDCLVKLMRFNGYDVEVQNYIDNTGVQVADVVAGFLYLEKKTLEDVQKYCGMLMDTTEIIRRQIADNKTVDEMIEADVLKDWKDWEGSFSRSDWIKIVHASLTSR